MLIRIILLLILNFIPAAIALGILIHLDWDEWEDDLAFGMFICYISWPFLTILHIGYLIMNNIGKLGLFVAGFLDSIAKAKEEKKMSKVVTNTCHDCIHNGQRTMENEVERCCSSPCTTCSRRSKYN